MNYPASVVVEPRQTARGIRTSWDVVKYHPLVGRRVLGTFGDETKARNEAAVIAFQIHLKEIGLSSPQDARVEASESS